jgi:hypothetical protein
MTKSIKEANEEAKQIAEEFNRALCDVRFIERVGEWEVYMAGGVWMTASYLREIQEKGDYDKRFE